MFCIDPYYNYMIFRTVYYWYKFQKARKRYRYLKFFIDKGVMNITSVLKSTNYSHSASSHFPLGIPALPPFYV